MPSFRHLKSVIRLNELAEDPIDLSEDGCLTPKRIEGMIAEACGLKLFYGTERVSDNTLGALFDLAEEMQASQKMEAMQAGEVVNYIEGFESEKRPALHTSMRDFFEQQNTSPIAKEATHLAYRELEKLRAFLSEIESKDQFTDLVQIGIGGSELGPKAIYVALQAFHKPHRHVHFLSNVDPDDGAEIFKKVNLEKTLVVVVSKSGSTLETLTNEQFAQEFFRKAGLDPKNHFVAVTGKDSPMDDPKRYLASFYIWDYIGGRYSATSMVGGVTLAFALGMDRFLDFLRGASAMDKVALRKDPKLNLPLLSALLGIWNRDFLGLPTVAIIPYSQALARFPAHLQQLDMESNGKRIDKRGHVVDFDTGPIIWGEPGTNGQHSFYQSIHQGTTVVALEFIGFISSQYKEDVVYEGTTCQEKLLANLFAQSIALSCGQKNDNPNKFFPGNRPNRILLGERLDPYTMGAILAYYEHKVAFQGFIWNINSFDQEGVQLGKKLALKIVEQFAAKRQGKPIDPKGFPLGLAFLKQF
ncbi:MAG: glucose-6-phosphate isomerase [Rhabdochlamydiaceae bacterium]|nr:glucose-6-phosphate isomerase [Rhabdochlamydiaceae bacterium]